MIFDLITIFILGGLLLTAIYTVLKYLGKFPDRTIDDVAPYLRPTDLETFESILGPAEEFNFRLRFPAKQFRQIQNKRIHLLREYLSRMSHNALVLIEWGNMEWTGPQNEERQKLAQELVQAGVEFRLYSLLALAKLKMWIIFRPLLPALSLAELRKVAGIDAVRAYVRVRLAAESLGQTYGRVYCQELSARL